MAGKRTSKASKASSSSLKPATPSPAPSRSPSPSPKPASVPESHRNPLPFLLILPLISRLVTFSLNSLLLHHISPSLLGLSLQLDLLQSTIVFFSRESLRVALLRTGKSPAQTTRAINLAFLSIPLGLFFTLVLGKAYIFGSDGLDTVKTQATWIYLLAAIIELTIEPSFARAQIQGRYGLRALGEGSAAVGRALAVSLGVALVERRGGEAGLMQFAYGQLTYALMLVAIHFVFGKSYQLLFPRPVPAPTPTSDPSPSDQLLKEDAEKAHARWLDPPQLYLATTLFLQNALKHLLTRGDTLLLSLLSSSSSQGLYGLASNYGSLLARLLFQPLEESSRSEFSKSIAANQPQRARHLLRLLIKAYSLLALFMVALAPPLVPAFLKFVAGPAFATPEAESVLTAYLYYIPILALNGITEAFVTSAAKPGELHGQSVVMMVISGIFVALGWGLVEKEGARGLVWANMVNLGLRILYAGWFILGFFNKIDAGKTAAQRRAEEDAETSLLPEGMVTAVVGGLALALRKKQLGEVETLEGLVKVAGAIALVGVVTLVVERRFVKEGLTTFGLGAVARRIPGDINWGVPSKDEESKKEL
ncbi:Rft-1-domain-containing protein [Ascobolus immersus RN42]|uniref:Man(5)GlcNAc(2)-PP-dolichol translocation protein RFT1 n=1 Tax=Ascobolus immersus RN42 TaxID=1160509 RepID=A0A3N4HHX7_ASCIM|nr:Rft-1-domain-containing protein [Ascobolus immersus RN42]